MMHSSQAHFAAAHTLVGQPLADGPYKKAVEEVIAHEIAKGNTRCPALEAIARSGVSESLVIVRRDAYLGDREGYINLIAGDGVSRETAALLVDNIMNQQKFC